MRTLPSGTVTFLFTDIEGSTKLLHELGAEQYAKALGEHRRVLREAFRAHGGVEVDTQGDAFFVAFPTAPGAQDAAAQALEGLSQGPIRVRMGLHTGKPHLSEEGYVGVDVNRAARIAASGHGGQVLLSRATRDLLDQGVELRDLGEHRLKDLAEPVWLFQLGLGEFPPLKSLNNSNLPTPATPLLGRERELADLCELLRTDELRLVTLTGAGGTGKTRLALKVGLDLLDEFPNGVFFVGLAPLVDPSLVPPTIAQVLGVKEGGSQPLRKLLCEHLAEKTLLLLVDNCEHLLAATPLLSDLLAAAPRLSVLATSRERLRLSGEHEFPLAPLAEKEALELFTARARAAQPSFALDGHQAEVIEICRRLDGLPLAIELAAARVRVFSPQALLARLERRLPLLAGGARDAPKRQRTLRATIAWSYELLERNEQKLFARLAVFAGGCALAAAEEVCDADLETLSALIDKSLLRQSGDRFLMLETLREYALERLERSGDAEELRRRHTQHFLGVARKAEGGLGGTEEATWLELLEAEHDNLRAVLFRDEGDAQLELAGSLWHFWVVRGHFEEGSHWLREVLERGTGKSELRAHALHVAAALALYRRDAASMRPYAEEALKLFETTGDKSGMAGALLSLGNVTVLEEDPERARVLFERCRAMALETDDRRYLASAILNLGDLALQGADWEQAFALSSEGLALGREQGWQEGIESGLGNAGLASFRLGRYDEAAAMCKEGLELARELVAKTHIANDLVLPAALAAARGGLKEAFFLLAIAEAQVEAGVAPLFGAEQDLRDETMSLLRAQLDPEELAQAEGAAQGISFDEAVNHALLSL